jgi:hypothetical protein
MGQMKNSYRNFLVRKRVGKRQLWKPKHRYGIEDIAV